MDSIVVKIVDGTFIFVLIWKIIELACLRQVYFLLLYLMVIIFTKVRLQSGQVAFTEISTMNHRVKVVVKCMYKWTRI